MHTIVSFRVPHHKKQSLRYVSAMKQIAGNLLVHVFSLAAELESRLEQYVKPTSRSQDLSLVWDLYQDEEHRIRVDVHLVEEEETIGLGSQKRKTQVVLGTWPHLYVIESGFRHMSVQERVFSAVEAATQMAPQIANYLK